MRKVLATTRPLKYGDLSLAKSQTSLQAIAQSNKEIPLTLDHDSDPIGSIKSLEFSVRDGIGQLSGVISDTLLKKYQIPGISLKYLGKIQDGLIDIQKVVHATLTQTPRDSHTMLADNDQPLIEFQDSDDEIETPANPDSPDSTPANPDDTESETEIEITDQILEALIAKMVLDPRMQSLVAAKVPEPADEPALMPAPEVPIQPLKIIIKHAKPKVVSPATPKPTMQKPFRSSR